MLVAAALVAGGCGVDAPSGAGPGRVVTVTRVVDGDTLAVGDERVRLIGVDTPETVRPGSPVECFGRAASAFTERLVEGRRVRLEFDVERRDRYGRLLAYVHRAGQMVNATLVREGYATPSAVPPNVRHAERFAALARRARQERRGRWAAC